MTTAETHHSLPPKYFMNWVGTVTDAATVTDLPVLYPEIPEGADVAEGTDEQAAAEQAEVDGEAAVAAAEEAIPELTPIEDGPPFADEDEEELVVSEWPDPAESGG